MKQRNITINIIFEEIINSNKTSLFFLCYIEFFTIYLNSICVLVMG
jgi:hypothetical protein